MWSHPSPNLCGGDRDVDTSEHTGAFGCTAWLGGGSLNFSVLKERPETHEGVLGTQKSSR
jgi:hypothetical protein